jgi:hypothetical protein
MSDRDTMIAVEAMTRLLAIDEVAASLGVPRESLRRPR